MSDRIGKYLDGSLEIIALSPEERAQAEAIERAIDDTRAFVAARSAPDLTDRVMRQIEAGPVPRSASPASRASTLWTRLWTPRVVSVRLRPIALVPAAALVVLAIVVFGGRQSRPLDALPTALSGDSTQLLVQFRLQAPGATSVRLAGSFTSWQPEYELHQSAPGLWMVTIPLPAGVHDYAFLVDNQQWMSDPYALAVDDGFGGTNSRIALLPPDESRS